MSCSGQLGHIALMSPCLEVFGSILVFFFFFSGDGTWGSHTCPEALFESKLSSVSVVPTCLCILIHFLSVDQTPHRPAAHKILAICHLSAFNPMALILVTTCANATYLLLNPFTGTDPIPMEQLPPSSAAIDRPWELLICLCICFGLGHFLMLLLVAKLSDELGIIVGTGD